MKRYSKISLVAALFATTLLLLSCGKKEETTASASSEMTTPAAAPAEEKILNFYNWPDYIPKNMLSEFEAQTGIKVNYDTFENNEVLQAKLIAGSSGYDIVVPGSTVIKSLIDAGLLQKLDKQQIPNWKNLDKGLMDALNTADPGNEHGFPWAWGFTTVGINQGKVQKALGSTPIPTNSFELLFNPAYSNKLKSCGIAFLDSPLEVLPAALLYVGKNAYSNDLADHKLAGEMLSKIRGNVKVFSSTLIDDLASGKVCAVLGWSGDINIARTRAIENKNGQDIVALLPDIGALPFFDLLAITKDAKHPGNAHIFFNYLLNGNISATMTNELNYATANTEAQQFIAPEKAANKTIFPEASYVATKFVPPAAYSNEGRASITEIFTKFKKGK